MRSRIAGAGGLPAGVRQARNGVAGGCECRCARHRTRHRTVARAVELAGCSGARAKGVSPERASERSERASERGRQPERASSAGETFYALQAGLWRGDCGGNALHLHLICANNDDKHGAGAQVAGVSRDAQRHLVRSCADVDAAGYRVERHCHRAQPAGSLAAPADVGRRLRLSMVTCPCGCALRSPARR